MKKSINLWAFPYPGRMTLKECLQLARDAGFDGIELNYDLENDLSPKSGPREYEAIRRTAEDTRLTYKGHKREAATKTRKEVEVTVGDGRAETATEMSELLVCLGFRPVAVVRKKRVAYHLDRPVGGKPRAVEVCFDEVEKVGSFVEVELVAEESAFEDAKAAVLGLATELGLTDQERRSYLGMLLETLGKP